MNKTILTIVVVMVVAGAGLAGWYLKQGPTEQNQNQQNKPNTNPPTQANNDITVSSPQPNQVITSPLAISGQAKGTWYFEASFPIKLLDGNGTQIAQTIATAQADWMTTNFVPFTALLTFSTPGTATGTLVFMKDNPSGLPQNDAQFILPINF